MDRPKTSSVSQCNAFDSCNRKWFNQSVLYLPSEPRRATAKGSKLHEVVERYLDVDENHLKDGKPPELYPKGWEIQKDYFGKQVLFVLDKSEQDVIKAAVEKAISEGILVRRPESLVEHNIVVPVDPLLNFKGMIDYAYDWTIEDHKSCKNFRFTVVEDKNHKRYIGNDIQLKTYAYHWAKLRESQGHTIPEFITIRHNQYLLDPLAFYTTTEPVRKVQTDVPFEECEKTWLKLKETALAQLEIRKKHYSGDLAAKDMEKNFNHCGAYGGCSFRNICAGQESPNSYKRRVELKVKELTLQVTKDKEMAFNLNGGATSAQAEVLKEAEKANKEEPKIKEEPKGTSSIEELTKGIDETTKELAALVSSLEAAGIDKETIEAAPKVKAAKDRLGKLTAERDQLIKDEEEKAKVKAETIAKAKAEKEAADKAAADKAAADKAAADKAAADKAKAEAEAKEEPKEEELKEEPKEEEPKKETKPKEPCFKPKAKAKTRRSGVTVLINCTHISGPRGNHISISDYFNLKSEEMAYGNKVDSFYDLDVFGRKEEFMRSSKALVDEIHDGGWTITAYNLDPDQKALVNALAKDERTVVIQGGS